MEHTGDWQRSRRQLECVCVCVCVCMRVCVLFTLGSHIDTMKITPNPSSDMKPLATLEDNKEKLEMMCVSNVEQEQKL